MTNTPTPEAIVKAALERAADVDVKYPSNESLEYQNGWDYAGLAIQEAILALTSDPAAVAQIIQNAGGKTDTNLYAVGYDVGFEDGFKEAQGRVKELEARINALEADNGYFRQVAQYATDDAKEAEAYVEELEADNKGLRHMILDQINSTGDDPEIMAATRAEWAARAKAAEAKLARAIETLQVFADDANWFDSFELDAVTINPTWRGPTFTPEQFARDVIEELKGGSDEQTTDSHDY